MRHDELQEKYFDWMYSIACKNDSYHRLLAFLDSVSFTYTVPMDGNRAADGVDLRYRFGYSEHIENAEIASHLDVRPCSVLEMMLALAIRVEEEYMRSLEYDDRTSQWFWSMVMSLGLDHMTDRYFDEQEAQYIVDTFLQREYTKNGEGGLFTLHDDIHDMRNVEIWCQLNWYLDEILQ